MISIRRAIPVVVLLTLLTCTIFSAGCFLDGAKQPVADALGNVVVVKGSAQYCAQFPDECKVNVTANATVGLTPTLSTCSLTSNTSCSSESLAPLTTEPTPKPTVTVEPTSAYHNVDPFNGGERWQGQWFRWQWLNASGLQTANRGIVVYGHSYHDALTQWNSAWGNYLPILPPAGYRFLAVYVHQEDFGPDDNGIWGYASPYFHLQYNQQLYSNWTGYDKTVRIIELEDSHSDYYNIDRLKPYAINRIYIGKGHESTGGYYYEDLWGLRSGKGNSWDGYILYLVPISITDSDIRIVGNFAGESVNWRFDRADETMPVSEVPVYHTPLPTQPMPIETHVTPIIPYGNG